MDCPQKRESIIKDSLLSHGMNGLNRGTVVDPQHGDLQAAGYSHSSYRRSDLASGCLVMYKTESKYMMQPYGG